MAEMSPMIRSFAKVARSLNTGFDAALKEIGLTAARARVMYQLHGQGGISQSLITEAMEVEHPTAVRVLDGLEAAGLVHRLPSPGDRRAKIVELTEEGRKVAEATTAMGVRLNAQLMVGITEQEEKVVLRVLGKLSRNIEQLRAATEAATLVAGDVA